MLQKLRSFLLALILSLLTALSAFGGCDDLLDKTFINYLAEETLFHGSKKWHPKAAQEVVSNAQSRAAFYGAKYPDGYAAWEKWTAVVLEIGQTLVRIDPTPCPDLFFSRQLVERRLREIFNRIVPQGAGHLGHWFYNEMTELFMKEALIHRTDWPVRIMAGLRANNIPNDVISIVKIGEITVAIREYVYAIRGIKIAWANTTFNYNSTSLGEALSSAMARMIAAEEAKSRRPQNTPIKAESEPERTFDEQAEALEISEYVPQALQTEFITWFLRITVPNQKSVSKIFNRLLNTPDYRDDHIKHLNGEPAQYGLQEIKTFAHKEPVRIIFRIEQNRPVILSFGLRRDLESTLIPQALRRAAARGH